MSALIRGWVGFAALGAGLVHVALAVGSSLAVAIPLVAIGAAELLWGVWAFAAPALPLPRVARLAVLVPVLLWVAALLVVPGSASDVVVLPMLLASLLDVLIAVGITGLVRSTTSAIPLQSGRYLLGLAAGALLVATLTIPAIAMTAAGAGAPPHGTIGDPSEDDGLDLPPGHGH